MPFGDPNSQSKHFNLSVSQMQKQSSSQVQSASVPPTVQVVNNQELPESRVMKAKELGRSDRDKYEQELLETVRYLQDSYESSMRLIEEQYISLRENKELSESRVMKTSEFHRFYRDNDEQELFKTAMYVQDQYESNLMPIREEIISLYEIKISEKYSELEQCIKHVTEIFGGTLECPNLGDSRENGSLGSQGSSLHRIDETFPSTFDDWSFLSDTSIKSYLPVLSSEVCSLSDTSTESMPSPLSNRKDITTEKNTLKGQPLIREKYSELEQCIEHATEIFDGTLGCPASGDSRKNGSLGSQGSSLHRIHETFPSTFDARRSRSDTCIGSSLSDISTESCIRKRTSTESMPSPLSNRQDNYKEEYFERPALAK